MKTHGNVIRLLRKNKSLSQEDVSTNTVARTTISKIERSNIIPTITTLEAIITKFDVTLDEFQYIRNDYQLSERDKIISDYIKLVSNTQTELVTDIIGRCDIYLCKHPNDRLLLDIKTTLTASLHLVNDELEIAQELVRPV
ncbi:helix-turn-helix domain-containing protein [Listeria booriae]|uniref:Helix-turn-helix transcriptional regulator n=1 Tax=Listeria booriae TaxID=1552123 RepID=A0A841Y286_9LIST|nr:helix-turn-helix transcriptional regulator [Listeria booriae]MBC1318121.1 helix-turn-helix transcriptional regulator [Listeria booriae]